jgi:WD40 repeat protein
MIPEKEILNPPTDGISSLEFAKETNSNLLLSTSWDTSLRLYNTELNTLLTTKYHKAAVLDGTFGLDSHTAFSGGLDREVQMHSIQSVGATSRTLGAHDNAVKCVEFASDLRK